MTLLEIFQFLEASSIGQAVRTSSWLFPVVEATHLVGLGLLGGTILILDLRLFGLGITRLSTALVLRNIRPYFFFSLILMLATGIPLALSEMEKLYYNRSFWVKMITFAVVLVFTFAIKHPLIRTEAIPRSAQVFLGLISLGLWFTVAGSGRWIGFS